MAVRKLKDELQFGRYRYIVEADIKAFFDNIDHEWMIKMLKERIDDKRFLRLIEKWLKAGILEKDGKVIHPITGTPQGGIVLSLARMKNVLDWSHDSVRVEAGLLLSEADAAGFSPADSVLISVGVTSAALTDSRSFSSARISCSILRQLWTLRECWSSDSANRWPPVPSATK